MIKNRNETSAAMDKALKNLEQAKARYEAERKKENEKRRKALLSILKCNFMKISVIL